MFRNVDVANNRAFFVNYFQTPLRNDGSLEGIEEKKQDEQDEQDDGRSRVSSSPQKPKRSFHGSR